MLLPSTYRCSRKWPNKHPLLKLFEYLALGRVIVASDQRNIREVLTHGMDALLFDPGNIEDFATAIHRLVGNGDLRRTLSRGAVETIHARGFTWNANAGQVEDISAALLDGRN
jgi:glycosyltransferase involved in cell wall biosynthesis